jgi:hypothetical protein
LQLPPNLDAPQAGQQVQCPSCLLVFPVPVIEIYPGAVGSIRPRAEEGPATPGPTEPDNSARPKLTPEQDDTKACIACGTFLHRASRRCHRCGARQARGWEAESEGVLDGSRLDTDAHRGGLVLGLGIAGLVLFPLCGLVGLVPSIVAVVFGQTDLRKMREGSLDQEGESATRGGWICGLIGIPLNILVLLSCLGFFWLTLAVNPAPPPARRVRPANPPGQPKQLAPGQPVAPNRL